MLHCCHGHRLEHLLMFVTSSCTVYDRLRIQVLFVLDTSPFCSLSQVDDLAEKGVWPRHGMEKGKE